MGQPILGCRARITERYGMKELPVGEDGMLWISGPNVMQGYLNRPDLTAKVVQDGWYCTGDIARLDAEGFITITGRVKRFVKVAGEMVSLEVVEKLAMHASPNALHAATSQTDASRGEAIVLFTTDAALNAPALVAAAQALGLPEIAVPRKIKPVETLPLLGTGKTDHVTLKNWAASA